MNNIKIYCDGACSGNQYDQNKGGWGAILIYHDGSNEEMTCPQKWYHLLSRNQYSLRCRRPVTQGTMRTHLIIFPPPLLNQYPGFS